MSNLGFLSHNIANNVPTLNTYGILPIIIIVMLLLYLRLCNKHLYLRDDDCYVCFR